MFWKCGHWNAINRCDQNLDSPDQKKEPKINFCRWQFHKNINYSYVFSADPNHFRGTAGMLYVYIIKDLKTSFPWFYCWKCFKIYVLNIWNIWQNNISFTFLKAHQLENTYYQFTLGKAQKTGPLLRLQNQQY